MITYNYTLYRHDGTGYTEYRPSVLPKKLPVLASIEAPNSSGKSTLLNIVGVCFAGHKSKLINDSLVRKMAGLIDSEYQDIEFEVVITSAHDTLKFTKKKWETNIDSIRLIGDREEYIDVEREYELVYDIPINPVERLMELTKEVGYEHGITESRLKAFQSFIREELSKAKRSKNPEEIRTTEERIVAIKETIELDQNDCQTIRDTILKYKQIYYAVQHNLYKGKKLGNDFISKKMEEQRKQDHQKEYKKFLKLDDIVQRYKTSMKKNHNNILSNLKGLKGVSKTTVSLWDEIDPDDVFRQGFVSNAYKEAVKLIEIELKKVQKSNKVHEDQYNLMVDLIKLLEKVIDINLEISSDISARSIIEPLRDKVKAQKSAIEQKSAIDDALTFLRELKSEQDFLTGNEYSEYKKLRAGFKEKPYEMESAAPKSSQIDDMINLFKSKCIELGLDPDDTKKVKEIKVLATEDVKLNSLLSMPYDAFLNMLENESGKIFAIESRLEKNRGNVEGLEKRLYELKNREESKYALHVERLESLLTSVGDAISKVTSYKEFATQLYSKNPNNGENFLKYTEHLGAYLAQKLGSILHIDREYRVKSVDIRKELFLSEEDKQIRFSDMGTGQSQSAYLMSKLNSTSGKKMIALFDEIAMMDTNSLKPIYSKLNEIGRAHV